MAVTYITKEKLESELDLATELSDKDAEEKAYAESLSAKVDTYCALAESIRIKDKKLDPLRKKAAGLKAELDAVIEEKFEATAKGALGGEDYYYEFGPKANKVLSIDVEAARELLGEETFVELAKLGVGDLRKYLSPPELKKVLDEKPEGARRTKIEKRAK